MKYFAALVVTLAACTTDVPPDRAQGEIRFGGQVYPVTSRGELWYVTASDGRLQCRAATIDDCYWSLRAHLNAQDAVDALN